jgi:hypothetical protein
MELRVSDWNFGISASEGRVGALCCESANDCNSLQLGERKLESVVTLETSMLMNVNFFNDVTTFE